MNKFCEPLGCDVAVKEFPDGTMMIDHEEVKKILREHSNIKTTLSVKLISQDLSVFECVAENTATGEKTLPEYGESSKSNLFGDISKEYPVTMAEKRAIDKAVLNLLGLDKVEKDKTGISYTPVHSDMLGSDINAMNASEKGNPLLIVSHEEILSIVKDNPIELEVKPLVMNASSAVFMATATNTATGTSTVEEIGEANPTNLHSKVAKNYPVATAYSRAVDKAVLSLLGLDKKVYSSMEIDDATPLAGDTSKHVDTAPTELIEELPFSIEEPVVAEAPVETTEIIEELPFAEVPVISEEKTEEVVSIEQAPVAETIPAVEEPFADDEVLKIGNCNGLTYGEVKGTKRFDLLIGKMKLTRDNFYPDEERTAQLLKIKEYARNLAGKKVA